MEHIDGAQLKAYMGHMALTHNLKYTEAKARAAKAAAGDVALKERASGGGAKGSAAGREKTRTASPSAKSGGGREPPGRPAEVALAPDGPELTPAFLLQVTVEQGVWLEAERVRRGKRSRAETIREVLGEAMGE